MQKSFFLSIFSLILLCSFQFLSLEEKVGQMLMTYFEGDQYNYDTEKLLQEAHIGGIILYEWANGLSSSTQIKKLTNSLQAHAEIPLFIAIDHEGGKTNHLSKVFSSIPSQRDIARSNDPSLAYHYAYKAGSALRSVGINFNLAPVVDLCGDPENFLYFRTYSNDPSTVINFAEQASKGYMQAGILSCLKHFPGHGMALANSHHETPVSTMSMEDIETHILPFKNLCMHTPAIMVGHLNVPSLDPFTISTFSRAMLQKILREKFQYNELIITDSLVMRAITNNMSLEEAAIRSIEGGADVIVIGGTRFDKDIPDVTPKQIIAVHHAITDAVLSGRISEKMINGAISRILSYKNLIKYLDLYLNFPEILGPAGSHKQGEIQICMDLETILSIQEQEKSRLLQMGASKTEAHSWSRIGIIAEDNHAYRIRDGVIFPNGEKGTLIRIIWKSDLHLNPGTAVLPVLPTGDILLQLKYQHASRSWELEVPRVRSYPNEVAEETARRCLETEMGLTGEFIHLGTINPESGSLSTRWQIFLSKVPNNTGQLQEILDANDYLIDFPKESLFKILQQGFYQTYLHGERIIANFRDPFLVFAIAQALTKSLL